MYYAVDSFKQKLSQKVMLQEFGIGAIPSVASPLNAKKVAMKFLWTNAKVEM